MAIKIIGLGVALVVGVVLAVAATRPNDFRVQRSASIKAAPETIFPHINDLHAFNTWNPFNKKDPNIKGSYSGAANGAGAAYAFEGNKDVGRGRIEITDSRPASEVRMSLHILAPMEGRNVVEFLLKPESGQATRVTWAIQGPMPYISKVLSLFCDMEAMIGKEFENGLADLKAIVEH
jgi:Polyketide cyclase / dehydrase and lipid transport